MSIVVLDLRDSPWVDGPGRTILDCAEDLARQGIRIVIGALDGGSQAGTEYERAARERGLEVERIKETSALDWKVPSRIVGIARAHGADLLHTHDFRSNVFGMMAARSLRLPLVATVHGWIANDLKGRAWTAMDKLILRRADHVIAVSEETRRRLGRWADSQRSSVIPNAVRIEHYQPSPGAGRFRASYGIADDEILIANIGRLSPEKGQAAFLASAREILRDHDRTRFVLIGIGPDRRVLEKLVEGGELAGKVVFAGYRDDMATVYNELDLVVQSSSTEGMPNVVIEALLMEVPVIATDVGGTREVLQDGRTGRLIAAGEHERLVAAIEEFLTHRQEFAAMAREGRKDMILRFDHARRIERIAAVYAAAVRSRRGNG